jgi:hypothetical protein
MKLVIPTRRTLGWYIQTDFIPHSFDIIIYNYNIILCNLICAALINEKSIGPSLIGVYHLTARYYRSDLFMNRDDKDSLNIISKEIKRL